MMALPLKQSTASQEVPLGYFLDSSDGDTPETGLTIANTDIKLWKSGATTLVDKNSGGATHISSGIYYCVLDATDTNTLGPLVIFVHESGSLAVRLECVVYPSNVYDSLFSTDKLQVDCREFGDSSLDLTTTMKSSVNSEADTALSDYDPPTKAELDSGFAALNDPTAASVADAVWDEARSGHTAGGSFGETMGTVETNIDNCDAPVSTVDTVVDGIKAVTDNLPNSGALTTIDGKIDTLDANVDTLITRVPSEVAQKSHLVNGTGDITPPANIGIWDALGDGTESLNSIVTEIDANETKIDTINGKVDTIDGIVDDILVDTAEIGAGGAGLDSIPWNASWDAEVQSECNDALVALHLDHLLAADYDPSSKPGTATALLNELVENDGGVSRFTANALEQSPSAGTNPNVLLSTTIATVNSQTEFELTAGSNDNDAYNNMILVVYDASDNDYPSVRTVSDYSLTSKTITIDSAPDFTAVAGDGIKIFVVAPGSTPPTAASIADAVWDEAKAGHVGAGSFGEEVQAHATPTEVNAQCDTALSDYDPPTRAELTSDTNSILAILGTPAGADMSADILAIDNLVDDLEGRLTAARAGYLDNLNIGENVAGTSETNTVGEIADGVWDESKAGHVGAGSFGEEVQSHSLSSEIVSAADIRSEIDSNSTQLALIVADTNELQTDLADGGRLDLLIDAILADTNELQSDDVPGLIAALNDVSTAEVNAQCDSAIETYNLHQLFHTAYDHSPTSGSLVDDLTENDGGTARFTSNALEQSPSAGTNPNVLIDTTIDTVNSQTSFTLTAGSSIDDSYKDQAVVVYDASVSDYPSVRVCSTYTGSTKTITLDSAPDFTILSGDGVKIFTTAPGTTAPTANQVADQVWDEILSEHITGGSASEQLLSLKANVDSNL